MHSILKYVSDKSVDINEIHIYAMFQYFVQRSAFEESYNVFQLHVKYKLF